MKPLTIVEQLPHGARFAQLPNNFKLDISIRNDMVYIFFLDDKNNDVVFSTVLFIGHEGFKCFGRFSEKGQKLLLERLNETIVSDICTFLSGKYEGEILIDAPYHSISGCFDIESYKEDWLVYYNLICIDDDILEEYKAPEVETDE